MAALLACLSLQSSKLLNGGPWNSAALAASSSEGTTDADGAAPAALSSWVSTSCALRIAGSFPHRLGTGGASGAAAAWAAVVGSPAVGCSHAWVPWGGHAGGAGAAGGMADVGWGVDAGTGGAGGRRGGAGGGP